MPDWLLTCMNYDDWMMSYTLQLYGHRTYHYMHDAIHLHVHAGSAQPIECGIVMEKNHDTHIDYSVGPMWHTNVRLLRINFAIRFLLQICKKILHVWFRMIYWLMKVLPGCKKCKELQFIQNECRSCVMWSMEMLASCHMRSHVLPTTMQPARACGGI